MRIRKYAKFSSLLHTNSNPTFSSINNQQKTNLICTLNQSPWDVITPPSSPSHHHHQLCQLNQSPWDIITFPSSHSSSYHQLDNFEVHYNVKLDGNLTSVDSVGLIQSVGSTNKTGQCKQDNADNLMNDYELYGNENDLRLIKQDEKKTNGKSMCQDVVIVDPQNGAIKTTKKKARPVSKSITKRRDRAKKTEFCQINKSPWDIITFPCSQSSSFHQFDDFEVQYYLNLVANLSSADFVGPIQSVASTNNLFEYNADADVNGNADDLKKDYKLYENEDNFGYVKEDEKIVFDDTTNVTNILCKDVADVQNEAIWITKEKARPVSMSTTRRATRRVVAKISDDFYYYSGFGPSWGKKTCNVVCDSIMCSNGNLDISEKQKRVELDKTSRGKMSWGEAGHSKEAFDLWRKNATMKKKKDVEGQLRADH